MPVSLRSRLSWVDEMLLGLGERNVRRQDVEPRCFRVLDDRLWRELPLVVDQEVVHRHREGVKLESQGGRKARLGAISTRRTLEPVSARPQARFRAVVLFPTPTF